MKAASTQEKNIKPLKSAKKNRSNVTELSVYLAERERQRQSLVHSLKGKFSDMKFSSESGAGRNFAGGALIHYVLDACALLAYLRGEEGAEKIETLLLDNNNRCSAHAVNLCEKYGEEMCV
jgi:hypothetical protein